MEFFPKSHASRREQGVALVLVLVFVVLLTALVVAYFSRSITDRQLSNSSFNQTKADGFARAALDIIVTDLKQEIANGSTATTVGTSPNQSTVYLSSTNANMVPMRNISTAEATAIPNLIRVSLASDTMASPGVASRASAVNSTTDVSANGRFISLPRWNEHYLIPQANPGTPTDTTPISGTNGFTAPNWVMVTAEKGPDVLSSPFKDSNGVTVTPVGRYAYAVYDEGGLLDVNVAGYPSSSGSTQYGPKGGLSYADLTALGLSSTQVDNLVGWRNYASIQASGSFGAFAPLPTTSATNFYNLVTSSSTGFLTVSGTAWNNRTDQMFLSRQQLIAYSQSAGWGTATQCLQYLGTFSQELNAPSFYYPATSGTNDPVANATNLNVLTLRMATSGTAPDGFTWNAGDPVVPRRFPLGRLSLIGYGSTAINTSTTSAIYKYFGLCRSSGTVPWSYCADGLTTDGTAIDTLAQVAQEGREPNFFELLKAAIHQDSLGDTTGFPTTAGALQNQNTWAGNCDIADSQADLQILRIGANIIDQANADSYPRTIEYMPAGAGTTPMYAYGVEDLPYINALGFRCVQATWVTPAFSDPGSANRQLRDQVVPVLWNPHRIVNQTTGVPTDIQLYMTGRTRYELNGPGVAVTVSSGVTTVNGGGVGVNDSDDYPGTTLPARYNEIGLGGFSAAVSSTGQNTGYIDIPSSQFSLLSGGTNLFANPSLVLANGTITSSGSAYAALPFYTGTNKIFGLTLNNPVYSAGRAPTVADIGLSGSSWNGYFGYPTGATVKSLLHHVVYFGAAGVGFNAVLRYKDYAGTWEVYSAFAGNEADPNGMINGSYDLFGICQCTTQTGLDGIKDSTFSTTSFPCNSQPTMTGTSWAAPDTTGQSSANVLNPASGSIPYGNLFFIMKGDPRTARFGVAAAFNGTTLNDSIRHPTPTPNIYGYGMVDWVAAADTYSVSTFAAGNPGGTYPAMWAQNVAANGPGTYYFDNSPLNSPSTGVFRNGKVRPGDDYFNGVSGLPGTTGTTGTNDIYTLPDARPVILHRPFRSVGELGYVFRDMPMKSLDMCSSLSVDAALLDFFTVDAGETPMVAGKVDINTRQAPVLQSILNGSFRKEDPNAALSMGATAAATIAGNIVAATGTSPLQNKAQLVTSQALALASGVYSDIVDTGSNSIYPSIKTQREAPIRALADAANTRTWNLLIDVIAQTGQYAPSATGLSQFVVTGERRYWLHIAIDRYTGKVIDKQLEPVYE